MSSSFPRKRESSVFCTNATGSPLSRGRRRGAALRSNAARNNPATSIGHGLSQDRASPALGYLPHRIRMRQLLANDLSHRNKY